MHFSGPWRGVAAIFDCNSSNPLQAQQTKSSNVVTAEKIQKRKNEGAEPPPGLSRRATDNDLRGMKIKDDDSEAAWEEWEKASSSFGQLDGNEPTEPQPLDPGR